MTALSFGVLRLKEYPALENSVDAYEKAFALAGEEESGSKRRESVVLSLYSSPNQSLQEVTLDGVFAHKVYVPSLAFVLVDKLPKNPLFP